MFRKSGFMKSDKNKNSIKQYSKQKQAANRLRSLNLQMKKTLKQKDHQINSLNEKFENIEKSNKRKLEFITYLSHEFKTPLNAIIGFTSLMEETELTREKQVKFCNNILLASKHLLQLTTYTMDMARAETDKMVLDYSEFNPNDEIKEVLAILEEKIVTKHLKLTVNLVDMLIIADKRRFKQLIYNFVANAIKFNKLGGDIDIKTSLCGTNFYFQIKDTGKGIGQNEQDKIFEFFAQTDKYKFENEDGTGIGLSLCKKIINLHRGDISFESEENCGTVFSFSLPVRASVVGSFYRTFI